MAEVLDEWPKSARSLYPWDEWLDGRIWRLKAGEDFTIPLENMRNLVWQETRTRDLRLTTATVEGDLIIRVLPLEEVSAEGAPAAEEVKSA